MKSIRASLALFLLAAFLAGTAYANTSSVNPNVPAQNSPLSSSVLRGNFANAQSDINTIYGILALSSNELLGTINAGNAGPLNLPTCATGALSWTPGTGFGCNSLSGLVSPITQNLVFTGQHAINLNAASLPTKQTGTVIQLANADGVASRLENDAFGATSYFTGVRFDGTDASPTALQSGDEISGINAWGYNGSSVVGPRASLREYASQIWNGSAQGTYVDIATTLNNTTSMTPVIRFDNDGGIWTPNAAGGDMGAGRINAQGIFVNGVAVSTGSNALSSITAALGSNTIENGANPQVWNFDLLTTQTALSFSSTSVSTGELLNATVNNAGSTGYAGYFTNNGTAAAYGIYASETGAANTGYAGYFSNTATATGYALYANGTAKISGNLTITGTCTGCGGGGGGSGTVNSGTTPDLAFFATSTSAVSDAAGLQYNATTKGLNLNGVNAHSLPDNGVDVTGVAIGGGAYPLSTLTTGRSTAVGSNSLAAQTTATDNTAIGYNALAHVVSDSGNTAVGSGALQNMAIGNTTTLGANTAIGYQALAAVTTGYENTAIGYQAGNLVASGYQNIFIGYGSGTSWLTGFQNVAIGNNTVVGTDQDDVIIGYAASAVYANTTVVVGASALIASGQINDTAVGASVHVNGTGGTAIGAGALSAGTNSTAIGVNAIAYNTDNTVVGGNAGKTGQSGTNNTIIGFAVGSTTLTSGSSNILIGTSSGVDTPAGSTSSWLNIGNAILGTLTAPTISSGFGSSPSVASGTSSEVFTVNVGTGGSATSGVIAFGVAAPHGYACDVTDSTNSASFVTVSVPTSTTTSTFSNYSRTAGTSTAWTASDVLVAKCGAY